MHLSCFIELYLIQGLKMSHNLFQALTLMFHTDKNKEREKRALIFPQNTPGSGIFPKRLDAQAKRLKHLKVPQNSRRTPKCFILAGSHATPSQNSFLFLYENHVLFLHTRSSFPPAFNVKRNIRILESTDVMLWEMRNPVHFW